MVRRLISSISAADLVMISRIHRHAMVVLATLACASCDFMRVPCVTSEPGLWPLVVGDSSQMQAGRSERTVCRPRDNIYTWQSTDTTVAHVTPAGVVRAMAPGSFEVIGVRGNDTVGTYAFVLPRDWRVRIQPESASVLLGDSVAFRAVAFDSAGGRYPFAPFVLVTPEFLADTRDVKEGRMFPQGGREALVMPRITGPDTAPMMFRGERAGVTEIIAEIGDRRDTARLVVLSRQSPTSFGDAYFNALFAEHCLRTDRGVAETERSALLLRLTKVRQRATAASTSSELQATEARWTSFAARAEFVCEPAAARRLEQAIERLEQALR